LVVDVAIRAVQFTRKSPPVAERRFARRLGLRNVDAQTTASDPQRRLDRIEHARAFRTTDTQAVLDDLERRTPARVNAGIALLLQQRLHFRFGEVLWHRDRKSDQHTWI